MSVIADPLQVLVIDDDPDALVFMEDVLARRGGLSVTAVDEPQLALERLRTTPYDVVVTDVEMPQMSGLDLLAQLRERQPRLPVIVVTAFPSVEYAVGALRGEADEFLRKPLDPVELLRVVSALGEAGRNRLNDLRQVVLAVGAHPDDIEIGVGGLLGAHHARGDQVAIVTLTRGARGGDTEVRAEESRAAARMLGARLYLEDLADTHLSASDPTLNAIQRAIAEVRPDTVYTHSLNDLHQDHRAVHQATMVAARRVPTVACYQSPSAAVTFNPNRFAGIDEHVDTKLRLLACFASQIDTRDYLEPDVILATARYWSRFGGGRFTEPLEVVRDRTVAGTPAFAAHAAPEPSHAR
jgi:LmbE family N-acetylglucosaminyl deacetylase